MNRSDLGRAELDRDKDRSIHSSFSATEVGLTNRSPSLTIVSMTKQLGYDSNSTDELLSVDQAMARLKQVQHHLFGLFVERRKARDPLMPTRLQSHVLESVREHGETSTSEVAEILNISVPTASQLVNTMVQRGWLTRETEASDRRRHRIGLTDQGASMVVAESRKRTARIAALLTELSPQERTALVSLAERIQAIWANIDNQSPDPEGSSSDGIG